MLKFAKSSWYRAKSLTSSWGNDMWHVMRHRSSLGLILAAGFLVSACGFSPLYGTNSTGASVVSELAAISVRAPGDTYNRSLRLALEDLLRADGSLATKYDVSITSTLSTRNVAIQQDTSVTRKNLVLKSTYFLVDLESGETLFQSDATAIATYNRVGSEFANIIAERDARERAANQVAVQIRTELAVFFERRIGS